MHNTEYVPTIRAAREDCLRTISGRNGVYPNANVHSINYNYMPELRLQSIMHYL